MAVIQEAWAGGVSTRRVDEPVQAMGLSGISKSTVSELCRDIDERVQAFLNRPIEGEWPYLWLDAADLKQRGGGRVVSVAAIIAVAANTDGKRELVGLHIGPSLALQPVALLGCPRGHSIPLGHRRGTLRLKRFLLSLCIAPKPTGPRSRTRSSLPAPAHQ